MRKPTQVHSDFYLFTEVITPTESLKLLEETIRLGKDPERGFTTPKLKPNRFGKNLSYPVKKYMCYGLYWDPLTYFYEEKIPGTNLSPYPISLKLMELARAGVEEAMPHHLPNFRLDSCLVNYYTQESKLSLHQDKEEREAAFPVIGLSLGSTAKFVFEDKNKSLQEILIPDRSLYLFGDSMRLMRHGVKNVLAGTLPPIYSAHLLNKERINFTLRKVNKS